MNGHVAKPIEPDDLFRELLRWIPPRTQAAPSNGTMVIPGVDVSLGMRRVLGKMPLYLKMLAKFVSNQGDAVRDLRQALAAGDRATAERIAHSSKGVCGNIGATELQRMAQGLETDISAGKDVSAALDPFAEALGRVIEAIRAALPAEALPASSPAVTVDPQERDRVLVRLGELLANDDSEANDVMEEHQDLLRATLGAELYAKIDQAVRAYDFEAAATLVAAATRA